MTKSTVRYAAVGLGVVGALWLPFFAGAISGDMRLLVSLTGEANLFEVAGALAFVIAAALLGAVVVRTRQRGSLPGFQRVFLIALAAAFLLAAAEEVSWGQWIFDFDPPDAVEAVNAQGELNLHNLPILGRTPAALLMRVFNLGWLMLAVLIPVAGLWKPARLWLERFVPVMPPVLGLPFLLDYGLLRGVMAFTGGMYQPYHYRLGEVHESCAAILFAIVAAHLVWEQVSHQPSAASGQPVSQPAR